MKGRGLGRLDVRLSLSLSLSPFRGYLALTEEGKTRLKEGGIEGAYLGPDGRVHIPGKRVTLYCDPSPTLEELQKSQEVLTSLMYIGLYLSFCHSN